MFKTLKYSLEVDLPVVVGVVHPEDVLLQLVRVRVGGRGVVGEAIEGHLLLGHEPAGAFVHLRVVNADSAKDGEGLKQADVGLGKLLTFVLKRSYRRASFIEKSQKFIFFWRSPMHVYNIEEGVFLIT